MISFQIQLRGIAVEFDEIVGFDELKEEAREFLRKVLRKKVEVDTFHHVPTRPEEYLVVL